MKLSTISAVILGTLLLTSPASAGWFDDLTKKEEAPQVATQTQNNDLVGTVMSQLGLNQTQAEGGLGSLLSLAKTTLGGDSFGPIAEAIPGIDGLLSAAPQLDNDSGMSGLLSKAGDLGSSLQGGAQVYDSFEKLGISKELAKPMVDIVKGYLDANAGAGTTDLLMQGLGALL
ncbi:DUF2780 domain-containing protein [Shewanella insulae]|uniref:DUF2780 domain-containing protein n=1 Tax=Shewanella insulae TaxID=2681496 RepID=A0A6L7HZF0_9GAMM|nr:DUF2780 domain-containing protein [Shewanella insulae]MCG9712587.1 DUF2780 domain-containing protein [Shewanella insulae]MCG9738878.1 DUF2780 domain-containing protein [Shewanella insulae]MCG9754561.1 DUF2780 domain-containing protein [Shewanella insulae]MXR69523.1 DUF2780 domain-containing protein [Shewanella insulae]